MCSKYFILGNIIESSFVVSIKKHFNKNESFKFLFLLLQTIDGAIPSAIVDLFTLIDAEVQGENRSNFYYIVKECEKVTKFSILMVFF